MHSDDNSHRIHIAANDPGFPAKREAAVALICAAITDIATPVGYTCKGTTWSRTTPQGRSAINLQRSRYGFTASITLRFLLPDGTSPTEGIWAQDDDITLQNFTDATDGPDLANIAYIEIIENPASLDRPMHILANMLCHGSTRIIEIAAMTITHRHLRAMASRLSHCPNRQTWQKSA